MSMTIFAVLAAAVVGIGGWVWTQFAKGKLQSKGLDWLEKFLRIGVGETFQVLVKNMKDTNGDGRLSAEEAAHAFQVTLEGALRRLPGGLAEAATSLLGGDDAVVDFAKGIVEDEISVRKAGARAAAKAAAASPS